MLVVSPDGVPLSGALGASVLSVSSAISGQKTIIRVLPPFHVRDTSLYLLVSTVAAFKILIPAPSVVTSFPLTEAFN